MANESRAGLKLHLGCGSTVVPGWVNIDKSPSILLGRVPGLRSALAVARVLTRDQTRAVFPAGIVRADVRGGLSYPDESVAYVYSSHMIQHMSRWQGLELVRECRRVLERGGVLRLATPNFEAMMTAYIRGWSRNGEPPADAVMSGLGHFVDQPGTRSSMILRRLFTAPTQWLYDATSLTRLLNEGGFPDVEIRKFRESALPEIDQLEHREGGLYAEARRP